jgi:hypothetical protein
VRRSDRGVRVNTAPRWSGAHVRIDDVAVTLWNVGDEWVVTEGHYKAAFDALLVIFRGASESAAREFKRAVAWGKL